MPTKAKHQGEEERRAERGTLGSHTHISRYSPIEKGKKASLFLNCPFSRKCSGLNVSGVAHSAGSLCSAVRLVRTMVPWRRQKRLRQDLTHATYMYRWVAVLWHSHTWADSTLNPLSLTNSLPSEPNP